MMIHQKFLVYINTNASKTVLYTGVTKDLCRRMREHQANAKTSFTGKYKCSYLIYFEEFDSIIDAIAREKEIKAWRREKKEKLIVSMNKEWQTLDCTQL